MLPLLHLQSYYKHAPQGSLVLFLIIYVILMSIGAGTAIPGGLFVPSILVRTFAGLTH